MRKTYKIDTINAVNNTKNFKQKAQSTLLLAYFILTALGVFAGLAFYGGTQYQANKDQADSAQALVRVVTPGK